MADVPADLAAVWPRVLEQLLGEGRGQGVEVKDEHWIRRCQPLALVADTASAKVTVRDVPFTVAEAMVGRFASMRSAPWLIAVV